MSRKNIENRQDLREEMDRLRRKSKELEAAMQRDLFGIREGLRPINLFFSLLESVTGIRFDKNNIRNSTLAALLLLVFKKIVSKVESQTEDNVYLFFDKIFNGVRNFLAKYFNVRKHREEEGAEAEEHPEEE